MNNTEWISWKTYHATLHRLTGDDDLAMMDLWRPVFDAKGHTLGELKEASLDLAKTDPKRWRAEHLQALLDRATSVRLAIAQAETVQGDGSEYPSCELCHGTGLVSVPEPRSIKNGDWVTPFYRGVVSCYCVRGIDRQRRHQAIISIASETKPGGKKHVIPPRLMTLPEYEGVFPKWRDMERRHEEAQKQEQRAMKISRDMDTKHGELPIREVLDGIERRRDAAQTSTPRPHR